MMTVARRRRVAAHTNGVVALAMLPDGRLASGSYDGTVRVWSSAQTRVGGGV